MLMARHVSSCSVIIDDLDVEGVAVLPAEADAPLIVDPDTVLTLSVARELLQSISRRRGANHPAMPRHPGSGASERHLL